MPKIRLTRINYAVAAAVAALASIAISVRFAQSERREPARCPPGLAVQNARCCGLGQLLTTSGQCSGPAKVLTAIDNRRLRPSAIVDFDGTGGSLLFGPDGPWKIRSVLRAGSQQRSFLSDVPYFAGPC